MRTSFFRRQELPRQPWHRGSFDRSKVQQVQVYAVFGFVYHKCETSGHGRTHNIKRENEALLFGARATVCRSKKQDFEPFLVPRDKVSFSSFFNSKTSVLTKRARFALLEYSPRRAELVISLYGVVRRPVAWRSPQNATIWIDTRRDSRRADLQFRSGESISRDWIVSENENQTKKRHGSNHIGWPTTSEYILWTLFSGTRKNPFKYREQSAAVQGTVLI